MNLLSAWLREYVPGLPAEDRQLADALTLRGIAVEGVEDLGAGNGSLFAMDITTNRVDAMNHYGVAREAAAIYGLPLLPLVTDLPAADGGGGPTVRIEAPALCGRFTARLLQGVRIAPSDRAVAQRFAFLGQKLISNAVDATNYVTLAMGHPTHAFDADKIHGSLVVRQARSGEKLRLLDGTERTLVAEDLVVADEDRALALAGVMGGWDTMITPETRNILVEAAWFDPAAVRRSARRHGLHTDASHRFERGADFNAPPVASALVCRLILAHGGKLAGPMTDVQIPEAAARTAGRAPLRFAMREVARLLGTTADGVPIDAETATRYLTALGCAVQPEDAATFQVTLPSWRLDLGRPIDLIEEIARVYGYNRFANTLPGFTGSVQELPHASLLRTVRRRLLAAGYNEAVSSTFCSAEEAELFAAQPGTGVALGNPLSEEAGFLRSSLLPGMLTMIAHNVNRETADVRLFESGTVFMRAGERVQEARSLAVGASGAVTPPHAMQPGRPYTFYDLKGAVEQVLAAFNAGQIYFDTFPPETGLMPAWLEPGHGARVAVNGETVGYMGQVATALTERRKLRHAVFAGELRLDRLLALGARRVAMREISRFPAVARDFSFDFPDPVGWEQISRSLQELAIPELAAMEPLEIFREPAKNPGRYSMLVRVTFQAQERTLREEELQGWAHRIFAALMALGAQPRFPVELLQQ
jgi:phenylalanyl-tRNA synthetase beta chain